MYKQHVRLVWSIAISIFLIFYIFEADFVRISSLCVSIVSIFFAVYGICISSLVGSDLLKKLKSKQDHIIKSKTQLGVIKKYVSNAIYIALLTLVLSTLINVDVQILTVFLYKVYSAFCFAMFGLNFVFAILVFQFILNKQLDE